MRTRLSFVLVGSLVFLSLALTAKAQSTFGSITGTVKDPSGAIVPNATVRVTNEGTGAVREVTTGSTGVFNVPSLDLGVYSLRVSAKGFTTYSHRDLHLAANQILTVNAQLTLGATATVVQVHAVPQAIQTAASDISHQMGHTSIQQLPLVGRHDGGSGGIYTLVTMSPGTNKQQASDGVPNIQGIRQVTGTLPTMDGIAVMAYIQGAGPVQPSYNSIQEVKIESVDAPAEFPTAGNIQVVTRGGTNQYHGSLYYDYNGNALNARNYFSKSVPFRVYNNFAASIGGPIKKNKLFFFADYEGARESATNVVTESVPLPAWRTGDFSSLLGQGKVLRDPFTKLPFPNNQIPSNLISKVAQNIQNYAYPSPNTGAPGATSNNWTELAPGQTGFTHYDDVTGRVDYDPSTKDMLFARLSWRRLPLTAVGAPYPLERDQLRRSKSGVFSWTHTFSPSVLNAFRFGATFHDNHYTANVLGSSLLNQFGIQGLTTAPTFKASAPDFNVTGVTPWNPGCSSFTYEDNSEPDFEWIDDLSWTFGRHFLKFGFDAIRDRLGGNNIGASSYGEYDFTGVFSGFGYADFLLGVPQTTEVAVPNPERNLRGTTWGMYAQDQFRVTSRLTVNYGVRWELLGPYHSNTGIIYNFDPKNGALVIPDNGLNVVSPLFPKAIPIETATQAGYPVGSLLNFNKSNIEPRLGFAYMPFKNEKTVIRGGYGIYANLIYAGLARFELSGGPFSGSVQYINSINNSVPLFSFPSPFLTSGTASTQSVNGVNPNVKTPYTQQWNLSVGHQFGSMGLRISYIGTRTDQLLWVRNLNQPAASTIPFSVSERPYPLYSNIDYADSGGNEFYNALEVELKKNYGRNLTFDTAWTWSKDLTDTQDGGSAGGGSVVGQVIQNPLNRAAEEGNSALSDPNRLYAYALYSLPIGQGQHFLSNLHGPAQWILGGWRTMWTFVGQSGEWFTPSFSGFDVSNTGLFGGRPNRIANGNLPSSQRALDRWFNASTFAIPGCPASDPVCSSPADVGQFGNAGLNILSGPPLFNLDFGMMKSFHTGEHIQTQFVMTMANALNHPNFGIPASNISSPTVGVVSTELGAQLVEPAPREIDFALRLLF
ncbi:MAG: carboxypeptidase regulatory-like domain-containing protein [Terriglobia bacterium]